MMRRHRLDPFSLLFGIVFVGIGLGHLLGGTQVATRLLVAWPIVVIALGVALFASLLRPSRER